MTDRQWRRLKQAALCENTEIPVALIVDSPWIPGFVGMSHLDYYLFPDQWLRANLQILKRFPDIIFMPGFWVEYGMAVEPSGFGARIEWYNDNTPVPHPIIAGADEIKRLKVPNPEKDGLMPFALRLYRFAEDELRSTSYAIKMVAARGPLAVASWIYGLTNLMLDVKRAPQKIKALLEITTETVIKWLWAQIRVLSSVEGIMVLDDIVGFLSPEDYDEFAHPSLKAIFEEFKDYIKVYHNDSNTTSILAKLADTGFDVFNFSHEVDITKAREEMGGRICLMGNIPPLDILVRSTPQDIIQSARNIINNVTRPQGFILSAGGGISPGTPGANISALARLATDLERGRIT